MFYLVLFKQTFFVYDQVYRPEQKTWKAASGECWRNGLEYDEMVLKDIDELLDKEFWIGLAIYVITTPWIEILGCFAVSEEHKVMKSPSIVICQKQCESYQFFGYSESTTRCACLHTKGSSYSLQNCIEQNNSSYFIVYKAEASTNEPLYCLAGLFTENNDKRYLNITRRFCKDQLQFVCRTGTASSKTPRQSLVAVQVPDRVISTTNPEGNLSATIKSQSTRVTKKMQKDSRSSFDKGAVIGGILGACSMIIVLAVLIVCKIRSKGIFTDSNTHNYEDTSRVNFSTATYEDLDNAKHTNLTATTNQACDISDSSAPVYEEVNKN
ncbi:unnamed protein product [Mytilus edulis]|uniref:C-type lectin domain-containing protein n=1 Tax=Mytilus edulis TaxID=6550 RepID=A0A8S3PPA4_MYTED|nr:unnamed protein product [Mytilus edulis]